MTNSYWMQMWRTRANSLSETRKMQRTSPLRGKVVKQPHAVLHSQNVEALQIYVQAHYLYKKENHTTKDGSSLRIRLWKRRTWLHEYSGERHTPWNKGPQSYHVGIRYLLRIHSCMFWRMKHHTSLTNLNDKLNTCNSYAMRPSGSCLDNRRLGVQWIRLRTFLVKHQT